MPLYEYTCDACGSEFEALVRSASDRPRCPSCGLDDHLHKRLSVPAAAQSGSNRSSLPVCGPAPAAHGGCGAPACGGGFCAMGNN